MKNFHAVHPEAEAAMAEMEIGFDQIIEEMGRAVPFNVAASNETRLCLGQSHCHGAACTEPRGHTTPSQLVFRSLVRPQEAI